MTSSDLRRLALALPDTAESAHMGVPDFRTGGRIFATLAAEAKGFGNLMLTPELQAEFVAAAPHLFLPVAGGWGRMGATHIRLAECDEATLAGALRAAWKLRVEANAKGTAGKRRASRRAPPESG